VFLFNFACNKSNINLKKEIMSKSVSIPSGKTFNVVLSQQIKGTPVLTNPICEMSYIWDFEKNMGLAHLKSINGSLVNITLHPLGIEGSLDFMSDIPPTKYLVSAEPGLSIALVDVTVYRVILDINKSTGKISAAIMFNEDGSSIQATGNFNDTESRLKA
jgi:hypothetical protein